MNSISAELGEFEFFQTVSAAIQSNTDRDLTEFIGVPTNTLNTLVYVGSRAACGYRELRGERGY